MDITVACLEFAIRNKFVELNDYSYKITTYLFCYASFRKIVILIISRKENFIIFYGWLVTQRPPTGLGMVEAISSVVRDGLVHLRVL
jgi:hypothetical protein